ncbi:MAG: hypothetical protein L6R45_24105 [Anaerolineae bacterium]|nr:hypothetical protein [Anaerolineae bacterium]
MNLNLPIFDQVAHCQNLLIAGMGGGFDLFCGLPTVAAHNLFLPHLKDTETFMEALQSFLSVRKQLRKRADSKVSLP